MRAKRTAILILLGLAAASFPAASRASKRTAEPAAPTRPWLIETVADFVPDYTVPSMVIDSSGQPHISWQDSTGAPRHKLVYTHKSGVSPWTHHSLYDEMYAGASSSIAIDSKGRIHIGFDSHNSVLYAGQIGGTWVISTVEYLRDHWFMDVSLILDSNDEPQLGYYDWDTDEIIFARFDRSTGTWNPDVVDTAAAGHLLSMVADSSGNPHMSYLAGGVSKYATLSGSAWQRETVENLGKLAMKGDVPCTSFIADNLLRYACRNTGWTSNTVASNAGGHSLAIDSSGKPHIVYSGRDGKVYATLSGGTWLTQTMDGVTGHGQALVVDGEARPHITYWSGGDFMYARGEGDVPEPTTDLTIAGMEVVQVTQDLTNTVPLVAGRGAVLRVYPDTFVGTVPGVTAKVTGRRGGHTLSSPQALVPSVTAGPVVYWDLLRGRREAGLLYRLPDEWLNGTVEMRVEVNPGKLPVESNFDNNVVTKTLVFQERRRPRIGYVPISYRPVATQPALLPDLGKIPRLHVFMERVFPVAEVQYELLPTVPISFQMKGNPGLSFHQRWKLVLDKLHHEHTLWNGRHPAAQKVDNVLGVFPGSNFEHIGACVASMGGNPGARQVAFCELSPRVAAHEIGHNYGLYHPGQGPSGWKYPDGTIQQYGYDTIRDVVVPRHVYDLMTYSNPSWISPFHYKKLFDAIGGPSSSRALGEETYLIISGEISTDDHVSFMPFWQLKTSNPPPNPPSGTDTCLELRDTGHGVLQRTCFDLGFFMGGLQEAMEEDSFLVALPLDAGAARVVLLRRGIDLDEVVASAHSPTVTVTAPNGGESLNGSTTVRWTSDDEDGDGLAYTLFYSDDDGGSWMPVAMNIAGTTTHTLDFSLLPGSTSARLEVQVSDGFNTASDASDGVFSVPDQAPWAGIVNPEASTAISPSLTLQGYGYDPEDGELKGQALVWTSSRDGRLGTGDVLWVEDLSEGSHVLTLTATDSQGQSSSDSVTVWYGATEVYLPLVLRND